MKVAFQQLNVILILRLIPWLAWNNLMPPEPLSFHVIGKVEVPNPGVEVILVIRRPQGINPQILLLDLILIQRPGVWPRVVIEKMVTYEVLGADPKYTDVNVFCSEKLIAELKVIDVESN